MIITVLSNLEEIIGLIFIMGQKYGSDCISGVQLLLVLK